MAAPPSSAMPPDKIERMMFLQLDSLFTSEVRTLNDILAEKKEAAAKRAEKVAQLQTAAGGTEVDLLIFKMVIE